MCVCVCVYRNATHSGNWLGIGSFRKNCIHRVFLNEINLTMSDKAGYGF